MHNRFRRCVGITALASLTLLLFAGLPASAQITIDFSKYPGADNTLGTGDDITPTLVFNSVGNTTSTYFTTEYSRLSGGVGFVVDSGPYSNVGGIVLYQGRNILAQARPDVATPSSPYPVSFSNVDYRFVTSADGVTATTVNSVSFDFVGGISQGAINTANFYDLNGILLTSISRVDGAFGSANQQVSYTNAAGIARVGISTTFSVATDNVTFQASGSQNSVPEPGTVALYTLPLLGLVIRRVHRSA